MSNYFPLAFLVALLFFTINFLVFRFFLSTGIGISNDAVGLLDTFSDEESIINFCFLARNGFSTCSFVKAVNYSYGVTIDIIASFTLLESIICSGFTNISPSGFMINL